MKSLDCSFIINFLTHVVQVVGYNATASTQTPYWIVRNSWGTEWGVYVKEGRGEEREKEREKERRGRGEGERGR